MPDERSTLTTELRDQRLTLAIMCAGLDAEAVAARSADSRWAAGAPRCRPGRREVPLRRYPARTPSRSRAAWVTARRRAIPGRLGYAHPAAPPTSTDVLVVGAGPAGSAAAAWAARAGRDVVLADAAVFPRDKTCGDGLTPRAIAELDQLGLGDWVRAHGTQPRACARPASGRSCSCPGPAARCPTTAARCRARSSTPASAQVALDDGCASRSRAPGPSTSSGTATGSPPWSSTGADGEPFRVGCGRLVVADGARSPLGRVLGREWHRDTAYGVAARGYVRSGRSDDEWISSHLELRGGGRRAAAGLRLDLPARCEPAR